MPLTSTSGPDLATLTTPSDEINLIPEFGIIEFTTETETPNSTEILIQQSSTISTVSKTTKVNLSYYAPNFVLDKGTSINDVRFFGGLGGSSKMGQNGTWG